MVVKQNRKKIFIMPTHYCTWCTCTVPSYTRYSILLVALHADLCAQKPKHIYFTCEIRTVQALNAYECICMQNTGTQRPKCICFMPCVWWYCTCACMCIYIVPDMYVYLNMDYFWHTCIYICHRIIFRDITRDYTVWVDLDRALQWASASQPFACAGKIINHERMLRSVVHTSSHVTYRPLRTHTKFSVFS